MIDFSSVDVKYGDVTVLKDFNLEVQQGEFLTLLGPSGCGKSTLLRTIAGFVNPAAGTVSIDGNDMANVPPERRPVGIVFQGYALFPHLDVAANVEFGLKARRVPSSERGQRVERTLEAFGLEMFADRSPSQLSGGQQQRVAIARAVVNETPVLLMDEPLSNLDTALRTHLREEIRSFHQERGITTIFVTHDQEEALSLSDRIVVLFDGAIAQVGTPQEVYHQPASAKVCTFIGRANKLSSAAMTELRVAPRASTDAYIRPERVVTGAASSDLAHRAQGELIGVEFIGPTQELVIRVAGTTLKSSATSSRHDSYEVGQLVSFGLDNDDLIWIDQ